MHAGHGLLVRDYTRSKRVREAVWHVDLTRAIRFNARDRNIINSLLYIAQGIEETSWVFEF